MMHLEDRQLTLDWLEANTYKNTASMVCPGNVACTMCLEASGGYLWFWPVAASMYVHNEQTRDRGVVRVTAVQIHGASQENVYTPCPTAATRQYIESSLWDPVEIGRARPKLDGARARPVAWEPYAVHTIDRALTVVFFNPYDGGTVWRVRLDLYGFPLHAYRSQYDLWQKFANEPNRHVWRP